MRWLGYAVMFVIGAIIADIVSDHFAEKIEKNLSEITELVMFSSPLCTHCVHFEQNVAPGYKDHALSKIAPLSSVNMDEQGTGIYHLKEPIEVLPTFVIIKNGKEVGRLAGYPEQTYFLTFIRDHVM